MKNYEVTFIFISLVFENRQQLFLHKIIEFCDGNRPLIIQIERTRQPVHSENLKIPVENFN